MSGSSHPTRERLIATMVGLLDGDDPEHITADQVLTLSNISKGSLYHHFADFEELLEAALIRRFSQNVDLSVDALLSIVANSHNRNEFVSQLGALTADQQNPNRSRFRLERARAAGLTFSSARFHDALGVEQQRLTDAFADVIIEAQNRGWIEPTLDPRAVAVFIQAFTLGRVVDDIAPEKVDPDAWVRLIMRVVEDAVVAE